jgi:hypothetical protein
MASEGSVVMVLTRAAAVATVGAGLAASTYLLAQVVGGPPVAPGTPASSLATAEMPIDEVVVRAADKAVLVRLCQDGLTDPGARRRYEQARVAHPDLAHGIGPDCRLGSPEP